MDRHLMTAYTACQLAIFTSTCISR